MGDGYLERELNNFEPYKGWGLAFFNLYPGRLFFPCLPSSASLWVLSEADFVRPQKILFCSAKAYLHLIISSDCQNREALLQGGWLSPPPRTKNKKLPSAVTLGFLQPRREVTSVTMSQGHLYYATRFLRRASGTSGWSKAREKRPKEMPLHIGTLPPPPTHTPHQPLLPPVNHCQLLIQTS